MYRKTNTPRWQLLTTVSVVALLGTLGAARADDDSKPVLWIEAGGNLEQLGDKQEPYAPPFVSQLLTNPFTPPAKVQAAPRFAIGEEARITFQPEDSEWKFSAAVRYGRANRNGNSHEETAPASPKFVISNPSIGKYYTQKHPADAMRYATTVSQIDDAHLVLDFQAGRDVGLGLFGAHGSSTIGVGIRIAQFTSRSAVNINGDPDFAVTYKYRQFGQATLKIPKQYWDLYSGKFTASRRFSGIGPSLAWDANAALVGNPDAGAISFDWGVNAALLFGRQKMQAHSETMAHHGSYRHASGPLPTLYPPISHDTARSHSVAVPNIGGFAGLSLRYSNAKISLGYRADFFFGAIDGGIDTRKDENRGFFGPYVSLSVGLGD